MFNLTFFYVIMYSIHLIGLIPRPSLAYCKQEKLGGACEVDRAFSLRRDVAIMCYV